MAYSIVHRGPLPTFMAPLLYDVIVNGIEGQTMDIDINYIQEDMFRNGIQQVNVEDVMKKTLLFMQQYIPNF